MPESLLVRFDALVARRGLAKNRSEVIRDLCATRSSTKNAPCPAKRSWARSPSCSTITRETYADKLDGIQHEFFEQIVSSMHVHLDAETCMEVIILRGESGLIQTISNIILGTKGVTHGHLTMTSTGHGIYDNQPTPGTDAVNGCARLRARPSAYPRP